MLQPAGFTRSDAAPSDAGDEKRAARGLPAGPAAAAAPLPSHAYPVRAATSGPEGDPVPLLAGAARLGPRPGPGGAQAPYQAHAYAAAVGAEGLYGGPAGRRLADPADAAAEAAGWQAGAYGRPSAAPSGAVLDAGVWSSGYALHAEAQARSIALPLQPQQPQAGRVYAQGRITAELESVCLQAQPHSYYKRSGAASGSLGAEPEGAGAGAGASLPQRLSPQRLALTVGEPAFEPAVCPAEADPSPTQGTAADSDAHAAPATAAAAGSSAGDEGVDEGAGQEWDGSGASGASAGIRQAEADAPPEHSAAAARGRGKAHGSRRQRRGSK
jgi:hypothetical protein